MHVAINIFFTLLCLQIGISKAFFSPFENIGWTQPQMIWIEPITPFQPLPTPVMQPKQVSIIDPRVLSFDGKYSLIDTAAKRLSFPETSCSGDDWHDFICAFKIANVRCTEDKSTFGTAKTMCAPAACPPGISGCIGTLGRGNWYVVSIDGEALRCQCGCVAEETYFDTNAGFLSAREMINSRDAQSAHNLKLLSQDDYENNQVTYHSISNINNGPEKNLVFSFITDTEESVTVSSNHPVVISDGEQERMVRAMDVKESDFLTNSYGDLVKIKMILEHEYSHEMVNFDVNSRTRIAYPNGFKMGDNAWQQYLAQTDRRILTFGDILKAIELQK